jgi:hypothetical protein
MTGIVQINGWLRILTRRRVEKNPVLVDKRPYYPGGVGLVPAFDAAVAASPGEEQVLRLGEPGGEVGGHVAPFVVFFFPFEGVREVSPGEF